MKALGSIIVFGLLFATSAASAADTTLPTIWFHLTNYESPGGVDGPQGWTKLTDPNEPWPASMSHVQVVAAAGIAKTPDDVLIKLFAKLKQHHIAFAIESLAQSWVNEPQCGHGVESYYDPPGAKKVVERIKADGGDLAYIAMDEPFFFGHYYNGQNACHSSIENVAERAVAILREYQKVFPNVVIGDIEPVPGIDWQNDYSQWFAAFRAAVGKPIAFVHLDINWGRSGQWAQALQTAVSYLHGANLNVGIIYNANMPSDGNSDLQWLTSALQNINFIEDKMRIVPNESVFHSWGKYPHRSITDQDGPGEDYLVEQYLREHGVR